MRDSETLTLSRKGILSGIFPRLTFGMLAILVASGGGPLRAQEFFDDFEDGDFADGCPASWKGVLLDPNKHCAVAIDDGDIVLEGYAGLVSNDVFSGDISVRTRCTFRDVVPWQEAYCAIWVQADIATMSGYEIFLSSQGSIGLDLKMSNENVWVEWRPKFFPNFQPDEDYELQIDVIGQRIEARFWMVGDRMPTKPTFVREEVATIGSGHVILGFRDGFQGQANGRGRFRYAWVRPGGTLTERDPPPSAFSELAPATVHRDLQPFRIPETTCGDFLPGDTVPIALRIEEIARCGAQMTQGIEVREVLPEGWEVTEISDGGGLDPADPTGRTILWVVSGADFIEGKILGYKVMAAAGVPQDRRSVFSGSVSAIPPAKGWKPIVGESALFPDTPFDECGGIRCWNLLGALRWPPEIEQSATTDDMRRDFLADGQIGERTFYWFPGNWVEPDYGRASMSVGLFGDLRGRNPEGIPTVFAWNDGDGAIDLNSEAFGGISGQDPDYVMAYAQIYLTADKNMEVGFQASSDDAIQILLFNDKFYPGGQEVWVNLVGRTSSNACSPQNTADLDGDRNGDGLLDGLGLPPELRLPDGIVDLYPLDAGEEYSLVVKVFDGMGGWNFAVRLVELVDENLQPVKEGIRASKMPGTPLGCGLPPLSATRTIETGERVRVGSREIPSWSALGSRYEVRLVLEDVRSVAGAGCPATPGAVTVTEVIQGRWKPSSPSHDGVPHGQVITWELTPVVPTVLTYTVETCGWIEDVGFTGAVQEGGSEHRFRVRGDGAVAFAPLPFQRSAAGISRIVEGFDGFPDGFPDGKCPDGWTCNAVDPTFLLPAPGVQGGRLRIAPGASESAGSAIWNVPIDLASRSFTVEFDAYVGAAQGRPTAEGIAFCVLDAAVDVPTSLGAGGGGLGYSGLNGFAVELDFQDSGGEPSGLNRNGYGHVSLLRRGVALPHVQTHFDLVPGGCPLGAEPPAGGPPCEGFPDFAALAGSGLPIHCAVDYSNGRVRAEISAGNFRATVIDTVVLFPDPSDGGPGCGKGSPDPVLPSAYIGFTAATGASAENLEVDDVIVTLYEKAAGPGPFVRGNANADPGGASDAIDIADAISILFSLFLGDPVPPCLDAADANGDSKLDIADVIYVLDFLFLGGPAPPAPFPACGSNPWWVESLGCEAFPPCGSHR